jgi:hypothetical protein
MLECPAIMKFAPPLEELSYFLAHALGLLGKLAHHSEIISSHYQTLNAKILYMNEKLARSEDIHGLSSNEEE